MIEGGTISTWVHNELWDQVPVRICVIDREYRIVETNRAFRETYGRDAERWYQRWRLFFLACEELFGYRNGKEWMVAHYRFAPRR